MGMSDIPSVFSFPGMVRGAVSHDDSPQASSTVDGMRGLENSSHPIRHQVLRHVSSPSQTLFQSPLRHHRRTASVGRPPIRETLNASVIYDDEEDGVQGIRINQYTIKQEIGRGSFGAVHLAEDQDGQQYAMKEFSKSRLRKRSQSHILRRPHAARRRGGLPSMSTHKQYAFDIYNQEEAGNPLFLIREEIAILKKLDHENVARLIEVLDDPEGDSLYMVLEMCAKGVIMKVGLDDIAEPYPEEKCRMWFRDMILGIEYLHSQGIVHRDIKPDNLLLSKDDVLKIVDFGVSEMFDKTSVMMTAKSAGSPAFLPPELCYAGHGNVSGTAADIWSMGVTLYCLLFGRLPYSHSGVIELYEAIKHDQVFIPKNLNPDLVDLLQQLFAKSPNRRIKMPDLRVHPWVTRGGEDMLLLAEENTAVFITAPTEAEMATAITKSIRNVMAVVRAVQKLKRLYLRRFKNPLRSSRDNSQSVSLPSPSADNSRSRSLIEDDTGRLDPKLIEPGAGKTIPMESRRVLPRNSKPMDPTIKTETQEESQYASERQDDKRVVSVGAGRGVDSLVEDSTMAGSHNKSKGGSRPGEEIQFVQDGAGSDQSIDQAPEISSDSPVLAAGNTYEGAYRSDAARILEEQRQLATVYS